MILNSRRYYREDRKHLIPHQCLLDVLVKKMVFSVSVVTMFSIRHSRSSQIACSDSKIGEASPTVKYRTAEVAIQDDMQLSIIRAHTSEKSTLYESRCEGLMIANPLIAKGSPPPRGTMKFTG